MVEHVDSAREVGVVNKWQLSRHPVLHIALDDKVVERVEGGCSHAHPHLSRLRCRIGQFVVGTWSAIAVVSERSHELTPWRSCLKGSTVFNLELISARSRLCCRVNWRQRRPWKEL